MTHICISKLTIIGSDNGLAPGILIIGPLSINLIMKTDHWNTFWVSDHSLTHWGQVMHICVSRPTITGSDNGLSPGRRQAIIWTNAGILLIGPWGTNFSENLIKILTFSFMKMRLQVSSAKWQPFCHGLNVSSSAPSHYLHQWWLVVNWTLRSISQWNFIWSSTVSI